MDSVRWVPEQAFLPPVLYRAIHIIEGDRYADACDHQNPGHG